MAIRYLRYALGLMLILSILAPVMMNTPAIAGAFTPAVNQVLIVTLTHNVYKTVNVLIQVCTNSLCSPSSAVFASQMLTMTYPPSSTATITFSLPPGTYYVRKSGYSIPTTITAVTLPPSPQSLTINVDATGGGVATTTNTGVARLLPTLSVGLIAEDDEVRQTGLIVQGQTVPAGWGLAGLPSSAGTKFVATYKMLITFNGVPVTPTSVLCQFIEKVPFNPPDPPGPNVKQFPQEQLVTASPDRSAFFVCKYRSGLPGVGVLDVYYVGPTGATGMQYIADYELVVSAITNIGASTVFGTGVQDTCVLGFSMASYSKSITLPDANTLTVWDNPMGPFQGCEQAVLWQRQFLGVAIQSTPP